MFVVLINYPPVKEGKEAEFLQWIDWSNQEFANIKGFMGRRLLRPVKGGNFAAILELETMETYEAMQKSPIHDEASRRVVPLLEGAPAPAIFEVVE